MENVTRYLIMICATVALLWAGSVEAVIRTSEVSSVVTTNGDGTYTYNYNVINTSPGGQSEGNIIDIWPLIVDYEVPLNSPSVVSNVLSPGQWSYEFISADQYLTRYGEANPFGSAYILHWYTGFGTMPQEVTAFFDGLGYMPIAPDGYRALHELPVVYEPSTDGFIFTSLLAPVDGPYSTSWEDAFRNIGDPPLPGGSVGGGGTPSYQQVVPEPGTVVLLAFGLIGMAAFGRKFRK
jgi:hypothetical protein